MQLDSSAQFLYISHEVLWKQQKAMSEQALEILLKTGSSPMDNTFMSSFATERANLFVQMLEELRIPLDHDNQYHY